MSIKIDVKDIDEITHDSLIYDKVSEELFRVLLIRKGTRNTASVDMLLLRIDYCFRIAKHSKALGDILTQQGRYYG